MQGRLDADDHQHGPDRGGIFGLSLRRDTSKFGPRKNRANRRCRAGVHAELLSSP